MSKSGPFGLTARGWVVCDQRNGEVFFGQNEDCKLDPIGLTKAMTAFTVLQLARKFNIDIYRTYFKVTEQAIPLQKGL